MSVAASEQKRPDVSSLLRRVSSVRRKQLVVTLAAGLATVAGVIVASLTVEMALDWLVELPWLVRALVLAGLAGGTGFLAWKRLLVPLLKKPDDDAAALLIEKALPVFRSRFIASIQLARNPEASSPPLVRALVAETSALAATQDFQRVVKTGTLRRALRINVLLGILVAALCVLAGKAAWPLVQRAFLIRVPLPHKTQIVSVTGNRTVGVGDDVRIAATTAGVLPAHGKLIVRRANGVTHEFPLERGQPPESPGQFARLLQNVQETFTYTVRLGDSTSEPFRIDAVPRPAVTRLECSQTYPAYTGLGTVRRAPGDLSLLAGSRLNLRGHASAKLKAVALRLTPAGGEVPMKISPQNGLEFSGELAIGARELRGFSMHLVEEHGVESRDTATYRIDVIPDKPPTVRITYPDRREELITQAGTLLIGFEANDDFGVTRAILHYVVNKDVGGSEKTVELDLGGKFLRTLNRRYEWKMNALRPMPAEGGVIEYWLEVRDNNDVTGPGIGWSEHYQAKLVNELEKRADLANRLNDTLSSLNQITQDEEHLNQSLGTLIFAKPGQ